jgi:ferredoxin
MQDQTFDLQRTERAMYRIVVDRQLCSGFGSCVDAAPKVFELDRSGVASLLVSETDNAGVIEAAESCPMGAISIFDADSGELVN